MYTQYVLYKYFFWHLRSLACFNIVGVTVGMVGTVDFDTVGFEQYVRLQHVLTQH